MVDSRSLFDGRARTQDSQQANELSTEITEADEQRVEGERILRHGRASAGDCIRNREIWVATQATDGRMELTVCETCGLLGKLWSRIKGQ